MPDFAVTVGDIALEAEWLDANAGTRDALRGAFPVAGQASRWGEELYVGVDVAAEPETTQTVVEPGTIAYWPDGPAVCLFWGPTPASTDETPVAASPVGPVAQVRDIAPLAEIDGGATMRLEE